MFLPRNDIKNYNICLRVIPNQFTKKKPICILEILYLKNKMLRPIIMYFRCHQYMFIKNYLRT